MFCDYWIELRGEGFDSDFDCLPEALREQAKEKVSLLLIADPGVWITDVGYRPISTDWKKRMVLFLEE